MSEPGKIVSEHKDRVVYDQGDVFVKVFDDARERDDELANLRKLEAAGITIPEVIDTSGTKLITRRMPGGPLDELIATRWASIPRRERNVLIDRVAEVARKIRDAGYDWPDFVTYHIYIADDAIRVLDPPRLRKGRLDLSALYWSTEAPTVSRSDRLRFWRAYAGDKPLPRLRRIGHRGRFRLYRWAPGRIEQRSCPPWARFVNAVDAPYGSADEIASHPELVIVRQLEDRTNARLGDLHIKLVADPDEARSEWENHRTLMSAGIPVPRPAVGGVTSDGRGLFGSVHLDGLHPMDDVWETLDRRKAVRDIADLARRLHTGGLVHKDLYLCHFFIAEGGERPTLIDLARVTKTTSRRLRVKDLAALVHSSRGLVSRTDLMRGLKRYGGDKRLAKRVLRKARRMARHTPKNIRDGTHVPHKRRTK